MEYTLTTETDTGGSTQRGLLGNMRLKAISPALLNRMEDISEEQLIDEIHRLHDNLEKVPSYQEITTTESIAYTHTPCAWLM